MCLIQLLNFKKWKTRLFKILCSETPRFGTGVRVTIVSGLSPCNLGYQICILDFQTWILDY